MKDIKPLKLELVRKVRKALGDCGLKAEVNVSEHDAVVAAKLEGTNEVLKAVFYVTTRDPRPSGENVVASSLHKERRASAVIRPTLAVRAATRSSHPDTGDKFSAEQRERPAR